MHATWLIGAVIWFTGHKDAWHGRRQPVSLPKVENGDDAQGMIDHEHFIRFPQRDTVLGQHIVARPAGLLTLRGGGDDAPDRPRIRLVRRGARRSLPRASVDPVMTAGGTATVMRLRTIVSPHLTATSTTVVAVGARQADTKACCIPDQAIDPLMARTFDERLRNRVPAASERIVTVGAAASAEPELPEITPLDRRAPVRHAPRTTQRVAAAFRRCRPPSTSEGVGLFGAECHPPPRSCSAVAPIPTRARESRRPGRSARFRPIAVQAPRPAPILRWTLA